MHGKTGKDIKSEANYFYLKQIIFNNLFGSINFSFVFLTYILKFLFMSEKLGAKEFLDVYELYKYKSEPFILKQKKMHF